MKTGHDASDQNCVTGFLIFFISGLKTVPFIMNKLYIKSLKHKYIYLSACAALGLLILYISTLPHSKIEESPYPQISDLFDMAMHFTGFMVFNFLLFSTFAGFNKNFTKKIFLVYLCTGVFWGLLCEVSQRFIPTRSFQFIDIIANISPPFIISWLVKKLLKQN